MPRWGRPPGARVGRQTGRLAAPWVDETSRIDGFDSEEEDVYSRPNLRLLHARQSVERGIDGDSGWRRRMIEHDDYYEDKSAPVDEMDYDLHDNMDSTVAYAVQLALKDKEERLVNQALDRIRRAQVQGQRNVRLSKRELEAIERKRTGSSNRPKGTSFDTRHLRPPESPSRRVTGDAPYGNFNMPSPNKHGPSLLANNNSAYAFWARTSGASLGAGGSPQAPSTRSQFNHTSPISSLQPACSLERIPSAALVRNSGSMRRPAVEPSPNDTQWVPSYQPPYPMDPTSPYPSDSRLGSVGRSGKMFVLNHRSVFDDSSSSAKNGFIAQGRPSGATETYLREIGGNQSTYLENSSEEAPIVDGAKGRVLSSMPTRVSSGRESRQRGSRP
ncbi:uncharacterized protein BP01DRAFT_309115 [Aspergillus saccharolyticus JOP 1030-1]|uniref:Prenylated rab acceptor 1 n=1 Tax=Aspergillus saccharolyticus JOP 1030-1 TaxID=1450539 RepID=A0A318Z5H0_9EURO|nr:hypothetical protein BP01DRAFT_309115 [Aspergillus saccharolyticus JOP 1030-1]PYH40063.1 hypothetical protein BP01DRAFT_309115 [Aspergillus saccharolyticus JOP 1030-1]